MALSSAASRKEEQLMSKPTVFCLVALAVVFAASVAGSQPVARFGGSFDLGFPQEGFRDNVDNDGYGVGFFIMGFIPGTPIAGGALG
jgi:hypothetical protein